MDESKENKDIWFKRRLYGWGWRPATWQGRLIAVVYLLILVLDFRHIDQRSHSVSDTFIGVLLPFIVLTLIMIYICRLKGEKPKWQWGKIKDDK